MIAFEAWEGLRVNENTRRMVSKALFTAAIVVFVVGTFLSLGGTALAGGVSSAGDQYGRPESRGTLTPPNNQPAGAQTQLGGTTGTLPFTGLSLLATFAGSFALIAAGVLVRRGGRSRSGA